MGVQHKIQRQYTIEIVERSLLPSLPGSAEPVHGYSRILLTRADVRMTPTAEVAQVVIGGTKATHTFSIRYTTLAFDSRHRIRTPNGRLYQILSVEDVELANRELRIICAAQGDTDQEAAR